jgi:hypothetical protein
MTNILPTPESGSPQNEMVQERLELVALAVAHVMDITEGFDQ